jgi:hypothetical protein
MLPWTCPNCGHESYRHVTDDIFRCNGCNWDISHTLTTLRETDDIRVAPAMGRGDDGETHSSSSVSRSADTPPDTAVHAGASHRLSSEACTPGRPGQVGPDGPAPVLLPGQLSFTEAA